MTTEPNQDPAAQSAPVESDNHDPESQLAAQLDAANQELNNLRESMLRERADLENQRKRLTRDVEMARKFANERLLSALLPVIDSLEAGLQASGDDADALRQGVELTLKQLLKVTGDNGLVEVNPAGQPFNPEHHEAMSTVASAEHPPGHVVQVYQKGWLLNERLLRPALVVVSGDA
ncbi:nucleotide exchange factor GrpE [Lysobacter ciconiae]|uniref:Protein GrpE n=1 Tax=Novilysobacter ciconiae TaxID=2781022 RepID=A0A7S6ZRC7_9GAMM|nr:MULTISPECIES: nucleotide exchange factor GrpE [Lysobacter]QOW18590.1 nucleotide exchange factor GrpE [Lysobacter ciconiae]QOY61760.1 nucleotide exchange factor GrpE [Lysobacter sp. H21R4]